MKKLGDELLANSPSLHDSLYIYHVLSFECTNYLETYNCIIQFLVVPCIWKIDLIKELKVIHALIHLKDRGTM